MGFDVDRRLLDALGLELERVEDACWGMAASFDYEARMADRGNAAASGERS